MNKTLRSTVVAALLLLPTAGVAVAQNPAGNPIRCDGGRCEGTDGKDTFLSSDKSEEVVAKGGDDDVELDATIAGGTDDVAFGEAGRDCIDGGAGDDVMIAGPGDDNRPCEFTAFVNPRAALTAGPGNDTVDGGPGDDSMDGIADDDTLIGGEGNDLIEDVQTLDSDRLFGDEGDDTLTARDGDGDDVLDGGPGKDECSGDPGDVVTNCENGESQAGGDDTAPQGGSPPPSQGGAEPDRTSEPLSFTTVFGSSRTTTALRGGLVTVPGMAVNCGAGPCTVDERLAAAGRQGLVGRDRDRVAAGKVHEVRVRLSKRANRKLRRRGRLRVQVLVTVADAKGRAHLARKALTVKRGR